ncbi:MAG: hypothetical protein ACRDGN_16465 [bacterium]
MKERSGLHMRDRLGERGVGILAVLALIIVLDLLLLVAARLATTAIGSTFLDQSTTGAFHAAEAGLNHLMFAVSRDPNFNTGQLLPADDDADGHPDFGAQGERGWVLAQAATSSSLLALTSGETVFLKPARADGSRGNVLYAVGYVPDRAIARAVRVVKAVYTPGIVPSAAILSEGDLLIRGSPTISGDRGSVHSNANLSISGDPDIAHHATATGKYLQSGAPSIGGISGEGRPRMRMPSINLAAFRLLADFELRADGWVYAGQSGSVGTPGTPLSDTSTGTPYRGWKRTNSSPVRWALAGKMGHAGSYYIEGDAEISGSPGTVASPWKASVFATGSIEVSGDPVMAAKVDGFGLVAAGDVKINGNPQQSYNGALLAREQFAVSGNPRIIGNIVATNASTIATLVSGVSTISGNASITFNDGSPGVPGGITINLWQELISGPP